MRHTRNCPWLSNTWFSMVEVVNIGSGMGCVHIKEVYISQRFIVSAIWEGCSFRNTKTPDIKNTENSWGCSSVVQHLSRKLVWSSNCQKKAEKYTVIIMLWGGGGGNCMYRMIFSWMSKKGSQYYWGMVSVGTGWEKLGGGSVHHTGARLCRALGIC